MYCKYLSGQFWRDTMREQLFGFTQAECVYSRHILLIVDQLWKKDIMHRAACHHHNYSNITLRMRYAHTAMSKAYKKREGMQLSSNVAIKIQDKLIK